VPPLVTVLGDATLDVHVAPAGPMRPGGDVPAAIRLEPGGQGANVAVRLARQGVRTRLVCALAGDSAGAMLRERLAAEGLDLVDVSSEATVIVLVLLDDRGERTMLSHRSQIQAGTAAERLGATDWLIVSGYALVECGVDIAARNDGSRRVVLGCSLDARTAGAWAAAASSISPHLVVLNVAEAAALVGATGSPAALAEALSIRLESVVVVTHADGAAAMVAGRAIEVPAVGGEGPVIDTTGAGDAFAAALVAELAEADWPPDPEDLALAMAAGATLASAVTRVAGAQGRVAGELAARLRE
jgi:ribokinase